MHKPIVTGRHIALVLFVFTMSCGEQVAVSEVEAKCGNEQTKADEECDDGNDTDACLSTCVAASCGDGVVGPGEGCDDANDNPTDDCNNCQPATCGDGAVQEGELCDDGNEVDTDPCLNTCAPATCGDGVIWDGEVFAGHTQRSKVGTLRPSL